MTSLPSDADSQKRVVLLEPDEFLEFLGLGVVELEACDVDEEADTEGGLIAVVLRDLHSLVAATTDIAGVVPDDATAWAQVERMGIAGIKLGEMIGSPKDFGRDSISALPRFRIASKSNASLMRRVQAAGGALLSFKRIGHGPAIRSGSAAASGWRPSTWRGVWGKPRLEELLWALNLGVDSAGVSESPSSVLHEVVQGLIGEDQPDDPSIGSLRSAIEARPRCMAADHVGFLQDMVSREPLAGAGEPELERFRGMILNVDPVPRAKLRDADGNRRNILRALALLLDISDLDELVQLRSEALPSPESSGGPSIRRPGIEVHMAAAAIGGAMRHYSGLGVDARPWDAFEQYVVQWMQHVLGSMLAEDPSPPLEPLVLESKSPRGDFSHLAETGTPDDIVVSGDDVPDETVTRLLDQAADRLIRSSTLELGRTSAIERLGRFDWKEAGVGGDGTRIVAEIEMDERHRGEIELRVRLGDEPASWSDLMQTTSDLRFWRVALREDEVLLVWRHIAEHMNHREVEVAFEELLDSTNLLARLPAVLRADENEVEGDVERGVASDYAADSDSDQDPDPVSEALPERSSSDEPEEVVELTPAEDSPQTPIEIEVVEDSPSNESEEAVPDMAVIDLAARLGADRKNLLGLIKKHMPNLDVKVTRSKIPAERVQDVTDLFKKEGLFEQD